MNRILYCIACIIIALNCASQSSQLANKPERVRWFQDLGFGMFIHWNVDVTLGAVISHSLAGASDEYVEKYINELPAYFNPKEGSSHGALRISHYAAITL